MALFRPYAWRIGVAAAAVMLMTALSMANPFFSGLLVDAVIRHDMTRAIQIVAIMIVLLVLTAGTWALSNSVVYLTVTKIGHDLRRQIFDVLAAVPGDKLMSLSTTDVESIVEVDVRTLCAAIEKAVVPGATAMGSVVVVIVAISLLSPILALLVAILLVPLYFVQRTFAHGSELAASRVSERNRDFAVATRTFLAMSGLLRARSFGTTECDRESYMRKTTALRLEQVRFGFLGSVQGLVYLIIASVVSVTLIAVAVLLTIRGQTTVGTLVAFLAYQQLAKSYLEAFASTSLDLTAAKVSYRRILTLLNLPPAPTGDQRPAGTDVDFKNVSYRYPNGNVALRDVSFNVRPGEKVAVVGESGSGKSTLALVLLGLITPQTGEVRLGERRIREIDARVRPELLAYDASTLAFVPGTILDNIRYGSIGATELEIRRAAHDACASEFISAFPQAYDSEFGFETGMLSMGQQRRIGVARAMLRNCPILVLDESTSSLDPSTIAKLIANVLRRDETLFMITHATWCLAGFDRVLRLSEGRLVYDGSPTETRGNIAESISGQGTYPRTV